jgi:hypothetical protein
MEGAFPVIRARYLKGFQPFAFAVSISVYNSIVIFGLNEPPRSRAPGSLLSG